MKLRKKAVVKPGEADFFPVMFDPELCNGCNRCVEACQSDCFAPNPEKGRPPLVLFPHECWHCGTCVQVCPRRGAVRWERLAAHRVHCRRKTTGEDFFV